MDDSGVVERSLRAVRSFKEQVERHGLWNHAWIGVVAIRLGEQWIVFLFRAHLIGPGVRAPSPLKVFEVASNDVVVCAREVSLEGCWTILEELARRETASLSRLVGRELHLVSSKNPSVWSTSSSTYNQGDRVHLYASHSSGEAFHQIFGFPLFERLGPQLRRHAPPYSSLSEIAEGMKFFGGGGWDNNGAIPRFEASAEFPIQMIECFYNRACGGIEIQVDVGLAVPLERLSASLTPQPRQRLVGSEFASTTRGNIKRLSAVVPCDEPQGDVAVNLQFDDVHIGSSTIHATRAEPTAWLTTSPGPVLREWEATLDREFHWTLRALRRRLRTLLPSRVAEVAEWRIRESILLRDDHPFFAVVSAASVAEVLLQERLAKVTRKTRAARWSELRTEDQRLPKKLRIGEQLKFDHAIRLAERLGLLGAIDSHSISLLRAARNEIHLDRKSRPPAEDFSPIRASHAILAALDLCKLLAEVSRARSTKRRVQG